MTRLLAELAHNALAHPLLAAARLLGAAAAATDQAATWLHDATARRAWPAPGDPMPDGSLPPTSLAELGALVLLAEREHKAAERQRDALRAELLERMAAGGVGKLELPEAFITCQEASGSESVDAKACAEKLLALGARLRELGQRDVDDTIPTKSVRRAPSLRITARF